MSNVEKKIGSDSDVEPKKKSRKRSICDSNLKVLLKKPQILRSILSQTQLFNDYVFCSKVESSPMILKDFIRGDFTLSIDLRRRLSEIFFVYIKNRVISFRQKSDACFTSRILLSRRTKRGVE